MVEVVELDSLIEEYWDLALAEGREGRDHDTPDGDAQRVRSAISTLIAELKRERDEALDEDWVARSAYEKAVGKAREAHAQALSSDAQAHEVLTRALAAEVRCQAMQEALEKITDIYKRNAGRQNEKLEDIEPIARAALQQAPE